MRFPPILNRAHFERSGYLKSFPHLAGSVHSFAGDERAHRELLEAVEDGRGLERGVSGDAGRAHARGVLSGVSGARGHACRPAAGWWTSCRTASATSRRTIRRGCRCSACTSTCAPATPRPSMAWREMWIDRGAVVDRQRSASTRDWTWPPIRSSAAAANCWRSTSAISGSSSRSSRRSPATSSPTAIISLNYHQDHFGAALRHPDRRRRGGAHRLRRLRARADRAGALSPARLRPRALAAIGARGAWPVMPSALARSIPPRYARHPLHRGDRAWPESNCYVDLWVELLHAAGVEPLAALPFTFAVGLRGRPVDVLQVPARRPVRALRRRGVRAEHLALRSSAHIEEQLALGRPAHRGGGCVLPARHRPARPTATEHVKTSIGIQAIDAGARRLGYFHNAGYYELAGEDFAGRVPPRGTPRPIPSICRPTWRWRSCGTRPAADRSRARRRLARAASAPTSRGGLAANPFRRYAARFAADLEVARRRTARTVPRLCLRHLAPMRRRVRARAAPISAGSRRTASADSSRRRACLRSHRHDGQGAAVQDGARRQRAPALRRGADARDDGRQRGTRRWRRSTARYGALNRHQP